jgi:hypothetical protein
MEEAGAEGGGGAEGAGGLGDDISVETPDLGAPPQDEGDNNGFIVPEWAKEYELDTEIAADPSLKAIGDVKSLIKSYVHAQRKIGKKGVILPDENSTQEEWDTFYQKAGVPLEEQEYISSLQFPTQDQEAQFNDAFNEEFAKKAHELRVRPDQAKQMYDFFSEQAKTTSENYMNDTQEQMQTELNSLRDTLGVDAYTERLTKTTQMLKETVGDDFLSYLGESGLGQNAQVVKALGEIAMKFYNEAPLPKGTHKAAMSKDEMEAEINRAMGNPNDPYRKPSHPDHHRRVNEINKLWEKIG